MLIKTAQQVFVAGVAGRAFRPFSRTCPTPPPKPPPKRWVTKTVCGTYSKYAFYASDHSGNLIQVTEMIYEFGGEYPTQFVVTPTYDATQPSSQPMKIGEGPYCMQVRVYE